MVSNQFAYKVINVSCDENPETALNNLGWSGWELVGTTFRQYNSTVAFYMKKQIEV
jgi:hypothetical protein